MQDNLDSSVVKGKSIDENKNRIRKNEKSLEFQGIFYSKKKRN
jgi:hypothetical protein